MRKLIAVFIVACVASMAYLCYRHPLILKVVDGSARILSSPVDATIEIDGEAQPSALCFAVKSRFDGTPADILVLWLPNPSVIDGRDVVVVDRLHHDVGLPNAGNGDYELLRGQYLLQSESGSMYASFKGAKFDSQDTHLEIRQKHITFIMPSSPVLAGKKVEIVFNS
jgi:hypothetical protein